MITGLLPRFVDDYQPVALAITGLCHIALKILELLSHRVDDYRAIAPSRCQILNCCFHHVDYLGTVGHSPY